LCGGEQDRDLIRSVAQRQCHEDVLRRSSLIAVVRKQFKEAKVEDEKKEGRQLAGRVGPCLPCDLNKGSIKGREKAGFGKPALMSKEMGGVGRGMRFEWTCAFFSNALLGGTHEHEEGR